MAEEPQEQWYCFTTQPKREHIAAANLKARAGLVTFCPRIAYRKKTRRGVVRFVEPLFPGYLFVYCEIHQHLRHILAMQGIRHVVKYGERIPSLTPAFIEELQPCFSEEIKEIPDPDPQPGESVLLAEGPFAELHAIVQTYVPATDRIRVLLDFLGREVSIDVPKAQILRPDFEPKKHLS
ncbi:MAG: transcription termination/antitermination NusG family protein [Puniceicoccaceae bacterium]